MYLLIVVVGYLVAYWHAAEAVIKTTFSLTFSFANIRLDIGLGTGAVIVLAEIRGIRRDMRRSDESWSQAMWNLRERLSDSAVALGVILAAALLFNLFRAPIVVWRNSLRDAQQVSAGSQRIADVKECNENSKQLTDSIAALTTQLQQARQVGPQAYIALGSPKLTANHRDDTIKISVPLNDTGTASADNVASVASVVFGNGPDAELIEAPKPPLMRILPSVPNSPHGLYLEIGISKEDKKKLATVFTLIRRKQPITLTVNLYFTVNGNQYSQQSIRTYDYERRGWNIISEQIAQGFVAFPSSIYKGAVHFISEPYLPTPPTTNVCKSG
jgi:hypothetical protein